MSPVIRSSADLPADGMIVVRRFDRLRSRGWHLEGDPNELGFVVATPVNIRSGRTTGDAEVIHLRFGLDRITVMPEAASGR